MTGIAAVLHYAATHVTGASVTLAWNPNSEANVAGYKIHYGFSSRAYPFVVDAGDAAAHIINSLQEGRTYYFAVTAYNDAGHESDFSGEISYSVPLRGIYALGDGSFRIRFQGTPGHTYQIEYTESLSPPAWRSLGSGMAAANGALEIIDRPIGGAPMRFYRSVHPAR